VEQVRECDNDSFVNVTSHSQWGTAAYTTAVCA